MAHFGKPSLAEPMRKLMAPTCSDWPTRTAKTCVKVYHLVEKIHGNYRSCIFSVAVTKLVKRKKFASINGNQKRKPINGGITKCLQLKQMSLDPINPIRKYSFQQPHTSAIVFCIGVPVSSRRLRQLNPSRIFHLAL